MKNTLPIALFLLLLAPALAAQATDLLGAGADLTTAVVSLEAPLMSTELVEQSLGDPQAPSSCYQACLSAQDSVRYCPTFPTPLVAEVYVSGPEHSAGLNSFNCVPSCFGPVVTITGFSSCTP